VVAEKLMLETEFLDIKLSRFSLGCGGLLVRGRGSMFAVLSGIMDRWMMIP